MLMVPCPVAQSEDSFLFVLSTLYGWAWMVLYTTHIQLTHNSTAQNRTEHTAASHSELRSSFARAQCSSAREQRLSVVHWIVMEINASPHPLLLISSGAKHRLSFSLAHIVRSRSGFSTPSPTFEWRGRFPCVFIHGTVLPLFTTPPQPPVRTVFRDENRVEQKQASIQSSSIQPRRWWRCERAQQEKKNKIMYLSQYTMHTFTCTHTECYTQ